MPRVSVVIPTYNYGLFIGEAIMSALNQTCTPSDIIVIDDGSTDDTESVVAQFPDTVRYIRQKNAGVCAARNRGVQESMGEFIAFLDADDTWAPTKLAKQIARFDEDEELGMVHCGMLQFDDATGKIIEVQNEGLEGWVADHLLLWEQPVIPGPGGAIMVKREAFYAAGGYDITMRVGEDWDFCYRVARLFKVGFVPEPLVLYRSHPAAAHFNIGEMEKGMRRFYNKAFTDCDEHVLSLRRRSLGNFHRIMAGSYFQGGDYTQFAKHAVKSIWNRPAGLGYFLEFPLRRAKRVDHAIS